MENSKKGIYKKMYSIMSDVDRIEKDKKNDFQNYSYASENVIKTRLHELLVQYKVLFITSVTSCSTTGQDNLLTTIQGTYRFIDVESEESIEGEFVGQGSDKGDKGVYKAITGAIKYTLTSVFLIPTGDDPEAVAPIKPISHVEQTISQIGVKPIAVDTSDLETPVCGDCGAVMEYKKQTSKTGKEYEGFFCPNSVFNDKDHHKAQNFKYL